MRDASALFAAAQAHYRAGRLAEAARLFSQGAALALAEGDGDTALQRAVEALTADETPATRRLFADIAGTLRFSQDDPVVRPLLTRAITGEWGPLAPLAQAAAGLVTAGLEDDELLHAALAAAPIADAALEAALTQKRRDLLDGAAVPAKFAAALAQQCFLNGHVFAESAEETAQVAALRARVEAGDTAGLAVLACYRPLGELACGLTDGAVLKQQRDEPLEEKRLAAARPALTPITTDIRESEPWPRWSGHGAAQTPVTLRAYLQNRFPRAALSAVPERPAMLSAGCGTGEYALHLARALELDSVTAIDLSRANLAFAARKAQEAGLAVRFGQGDLLQAAALGQKFGLIECGGVLHQLADPFAGWSALLEVLEPGGVMRIAVHSKMARHALKEIQDRLRREGFDATASGIRAARRWLKTRKSEATRQILEAPEFFTMGGCRHLLFPGPEHPLSFGEIAAFLRANGLALIGLDVAAPLRAAWRARFPADAEETDLDNWAVFEQENPQSFAAMIQFWVRKRS